MEHTKLTREPIQNRGKEKKKKILSTAKKLFSDTNYFDVTTNQIAKEAGISIGTLYSYFANKEDILTELLQEYNDSFLKIFKTINTQESFETFKNQPREWLEQLIIKLSETESTEFHFQIEMIGLAIPEVREFLKEHNKKMKDLTYELFLYYANTAKICNIKTLSIVIFDFITSLVDEILYMNHTEEQKERILQCGIDCIYTLINEKLI